MTDPAERDSGAEKARRRLRGLAMHFVGYFAGIAVLVIASLSLTLESQWFIWPMVGWGGVLAIHTAWAMGLFDILTGGR